MSSEREFLTKFLDLYRTLPCLWDASCVEYKDKDRKNQAWELLADVLKYIEPTADTNYAKLRIKHMRTAYQREWKKVENSKRKGAKGSEVHVPNLWYYKLLTFLDCKNEQCSTGAETVASDEESRTSIEIKESSSDENPKKKAKHDHDIEKIKENITESENKLLSQPKTQSSNSFAIYVSEQLDEMDTFQRQVAEKLISEVIFLAKTRQLNFDSKIETPFLLYPSSSSRRQSSSSCSSPFILSCSPEYKEPLSMPQYIVPCTTRPDTPPRECNVAVIRPCLYSSTSHMNQASHTRYVQRDVSSPAVGVVEEPSIPYEQNDIEEEGPPSLLKEYLLNKDF